MEEDLVAIIKAASSAPSGENVQPWLFRLSANKIELFNDPTRDVSLYNFEQKGSMVAHGAAIENIVIRSKSLGYNVDVKIFPDRNDENLVAQIDFLHKGKIEGKEDLDASIEKRCTNRRPYSQEVISEVIKEDIKNSSKELEFGKVILIDNPAEIKKLAKSLSLNEKLIFSNKKLHHFFFTHLRWNEVEKDKTRDGFYIKTLELNDKQLKGVKLFKFWWLLKILNFFNISDIVARDNENNYLASPTIGAIIIPTFDSKYFLQAGRLLQRIWLKTTKYGLSLQPVTGVLFLKQNLLAGNLNDFSKSEITQIERSYTEIVDAFNVQDHKVALVFRIGRSEPPSAISPRFEIDKLIKK